MVQVHVKMDLAKLSTQITANPSLQSIPFNCLLLFLAMTAAIKNDIILMQPSNHPLAATPDILLCPVQYFLSHACGLSVDTVLQCWAAFKNVVKMIERLGGLRVCIEW